MIKNIKKRNPLEDSFENYFELKDWFLNKNDNPYFRVYRGYDRDIRRNSIIMQCDDHNNKKSSFKTLQALLNFLEGSGDILTIVTYPDPARFNLVMRRRRVLFICEKK